MKNHCKCGKKLTGNEKSCPDCKHKKQQTLDSLEKFVKYGSFLFVYNRTLQLPIDRTSIRPRLNQIKIRNKS